MKDLAKRSRWMPVMVCALGLAGACGPAPAGDGGGGGDSGGGNDVMSSGDGGGDMDATAMDDAAMDARRQRDMGPEISTGGMCAMCFVQLTPTSGPSGTSVMVRGTGYGMGTMGVPMTATVFLASDTSCTPVAGATPMMLPLTSDGSPEGCFGFNTTLTISQPAGMYYVCARHADFSCQAWAPFTVH